MRSAVLSLSGRSERVSNLPTCLHQNPSPGCLLSALAGDGFLPIPRLGFLREIAWLLPVPKEFPVPWLCFCGAVVTPFLSGGVNREIGSTVKARSI